MVTYSVTRKVTETLSSV